jgi:hypothetical protein
VKRWNYSYNTTHYYLNIANLLLTTSYQNKAQETTSIRKTSQIRNANEKGKEYEKTVINHWLLYMHGLIIFSQNVPPLVALTLSPTSQVGSGIAEPMVDPSKPKNKHE